MSRDDPPEMVSKAAGQSRFKKYFIGEQPAFYIYCNKLTNKGLFISEVGTMSVLPKPVK